MAASSVFKPRWCQFNLRMYCLLITLSTVLAVSGYRFREWGRERYAHRQRLRASAVNECQLVHIFEGCECMNDVDYFDRKYWLPMKVYELTSFGIIYDPPIYVYWDDDKKVWMEFGEQ